MDVPQTPWRGVTTLSTSLLALGFVPATVAAQVDGAESMMCGTGIGTVVGVVFVALLVKAGAKFMSALDKMNSTNQGTAHEGKEKLSDAGTTAAAAFVPGLLAGFFEIMDVQTVSCLTPEDWSIIGTIVVHIPA